MKIFLLSICTVLCSTIVAQPTLQWEKVYGGSLSDYRTYAVDTTNDGSYITAGSFAYGYNPVYPTNLPDSMDAMLIKYNASGTVIWEKKYGGLHGDNFNSVQHTTDGGFIAAGYFSDQYIVNTMFIVKTNANGDTLWQKTLAQAYGGAANAVRQTSDGNYIVAGYQKVVREGVTSEDVYILKLNTNGDTIWTKTYGGLLTDIAFSIKQTTDGGYIVAGVTGSFDGDFGNFHGGGADALLLKLDAGGNVQWEKYFGGSAYDNATAVIQTTDGGYILTGFSASIDGDVTNNHGLNDVWVVKTNSTGDIQWQKCYGGTQNENPFDIHQTTDGNYIVSGYSSSSDGDITGHHGPAGKADGWLLKLNTTGTIIWQNSIGSVNSEGFRAILQTSTGFIATGTNNSKNYNSAGYTSGDYWLVNLNTTGGVVWQTLNGASGGYNSAQSVQQTTDGGYITAGYANSNNVDITGSHGGYDGWVVKTNNAGTLQWVKSLGGLNDDFLASIHQTTDGGYIVAGNTASTDGDITVNNGHSDYWVIKLSSTGTIQWQKTYGGSGYDSATSIQQTIEGGYIVAGRTSSNDINVSGNHGGFDYWIVKLDAAGNITWQKTYGGTGDDIANSVQQTADLGYIVSGRSISTDGDVTGNHGDFDYWIIKLDATGTLVWQKSLGGSRYDASFSIHQTTDGGYIAGGTTESLDGDVTNLHDGSSDFWIVKLTATGAITWQKALGSSDEESAHSVFETLNGNFIAAGYTGSSSYLGSNNGDVTGNHGSTDMWVTRLDAAGNLLWEKSLGGVQVDNLFSIQPTIDGGYIAAGSTASSDGDVTNNPGTTNYWLVKLAPDLLPVTLLDFNGTIQNNIAVLQWRTASEQNNKGFQVEKSADGITFTDLGFVNGAGTSSFIHKYSYDDVKIFSGYNYYRLKQVDIDGHFSYSPAIKLDYTKFGWSISGDPASKNCRIQLQLDKKANVSVQVLSVNGATIETIDKGTLYNGTYSLPLALDKAAKGIYIIRLVVNNSTCSQKIFH